MCMHQSVCLTPPFPLFPHAQLCSSYLLSFPYLLPRSHLFPGAPYCSAGTCRGYKYIFAYTLSRSLPLSFSLSLCFVFLSLYDSSYLSRWLALFLHFSISSQTPFLTNVLFFKPYLFGLLHCTPRREQYMKHIVLFIPIMYNWRRAQLPSYSLPVKLLIQDLQDNWINGLVILIMQHADMAKNSHAT